MVAETFKTIRQNRIEKLQQIEELGLSTYPAKANRTHYASVIEDDFESLEGSTVTVAGRIMSWRGQGALGFVNLQDDSGQVQVFLRKNIVKATGEGNNNIGFKQAAKLTDIGDLIEVQGEVVRTERGTISVLGHEIRLLSKALRPLPEKWSGIKDRATIVNKRYLDTMMNAEVKQRFAQIARMTQAVREFLFEEGYIEFQTPVIQPQYGGGTATPFTTHAKALDCDMYLAISHELYLKRLIAAGYDKVFTIGRYFRNEGIDRSHHPEFSMVETMAAYENYEYNMDLVEKLFRFVAQKAFGKTTFTVQGNEVDFAKPWQRLNMVEVTAKMTGFDFSNMASLEEAKAAIASSGVSKDEIEKAPSIGHCLVLAFEEKVEPTLIQPTLIYGHPIEISPLAKPMAQDPRYVERFEIFVAGMECGDNWSEQNDPQKLLETWQNQYDLDGDDCERFHALDFDFLEAMEYGMPPATGIGPGLERMAMIFTEQTQIDDVIFFPMKKPGVSALNAELYNVSASQAIIEDEDASLEESLA